MNWTGDTRLGHIPSMAEERPTMSSRANTSSVIATCIEPDCRWRYRNDGDYTEVHVRAESHTRKRGHKVIVEHVDTYHIEPQPVVNAR